MGKVKNSSQVKSSPSNHELTVKEKKLLARVVSYYQHTLATDGRGLDYLNECGVDDIQAIKDFGTGFVNGTLKEILPDDVTVIKTLKTIGILNKKGKEAFDNCIVFPLYDQTGTIVNLCCRNIIDDNPVDQYLPVAHYGLVNRQAVQRSTTIILTKSILDALILYDQGFFNVIPCYNVNGLTSDILALMKGKIKAAYLVFGNDDTDTDRTSIVTEQLQQNNIIPYLVTLPDKDINIYYKRHTPEEFERLLKDANPKSIEQSEKIAKRAQTLYKEEEHGFTVGYGERQYQIKGIQRGDTQLKAVVKVSEDIADNTKNFELTTIDLYSSRSRVWFAKLCANLLECAEELIKEDLGKILTIVEDWQPAVQEKAVTVISEDDKKQALTFLKNPEIFKDILADFEAIGITGEETNKLVGYLAATSRKLAEPLSVLIQSRSAAGKSTLQDAILSLIPAEDYIKYTRITDQALFYKDEDSLVHKILAIEEVEGMGGAAYSIRNIQTAKKITVAATGKDLSTGKMKTEEYTVKGPVCVMITTTSTAIDQETASRFVFLTIDESAEMTELIHRMQREAETLEGLIKSKKEDSIIRKHHVAQRMLKPLGVVNPYSNYLSYPNHSLRSRRDHKKYLNLIRSIAFLHQHQREIKTVEVDGKPVEYIEVALDDIEFGNQLANEVLGQSMDELAKPSRTLLSSIYSMVKKMADDNNKSLDEIPFTRRQIRECTGWTDWQIRAHIKQLEELEYINSRFGSRGKEYNYVLYYQGQAEETDRCFLHLTPVNEIIKMIEASTRENAELRG